MSGLTLDEDPGTRLPTTAKSRQDMLPDIPAAKLRLPADLHEMVFGEDA